VDNPDAGVVLFQRTTWKTPPEAGAAGSVAAIGLFLAR